MEYFKNSKILHDTLRLRETMQERTDLDLGPSLRLEFKTH